MKIEEKNSLTEDLSDLLNKIESTLIDRINPELKKLIDQKEFDKLKAIINRIQDVPKITSQIQTQLSSILVLIDAE